MVEQIITTKEQFDTLYTFRTICEQTLDYMGIEKGRPLLLKMFPTNIAWIDDIIADYEKGERMSVKLDVPDEGIIAIIQAYEAEE